MARRGMPAMVRMPCRSSKVRRRLAPVIFHGVVRDASPLLWRDPAEAKKKPPPVRHRRGQSLINDQNLAVRAERDDNDDDHHGSEAEG